MERQESLYLVVGLGKTGLSVARYLRWKNFSFIVFDTREHPSGLSEFQDEFPGVEVILKDLPEATYGKLTAIVSSPGVSLDEPFMQKATAASIPIIGDIELLAREVNVPVIAITGTNGKSTVTTLVGEMAKESGIAVAVAGNIGAPVLDLLMDDSSYDLWVLELSSFQLDLTYSLSPHAAVILNVSSDHLDRHHDFATYVNSKQRIYKGAKTLIYNRDDKYTFPCLNTIPGNEGEISFGLDAPKGNNWGLIEKNGTLYIARGQEQLLDVDKMLLKGSHNWMNAMVACALSQTVGISHLAMISVLQKFPGLPHRGQWVRTISGVDWINDSKGTNVGATSAAIFGIGSSTRGKIVLIAGGQGKGADFTDLQRPITEYVRSLVLIGEDADKIEQSLTDIDVVRAASLNEAVLLAQSRSMPGDVVLLSPACASFDMFSDFNNRGDMFIAAVNNL